MGLTVESEGGTRHSANHALEERGVSAVVFLDDTGATIWVHPRENAARDTKPVHVERTREESDEMFALRSAELLRGRLLPGDHDASKSEKPRRNSARVSTVDRTLSLTLGPALMLQSYAVVSPGFTGDVAAWFGRFGVGPYVTLPLLRNSWSGTKNELTFTQYSLGLGGRFLPFQTNDRMFELHAIVRAGVTRLALERVKGPQSQRFAATANFLSAEAGIEASFAVLDWLRLGSQTIAGLDIPLNQPTPDGVSLPKPAKKQPQGASLGRTQRHLTVSAIATACF